MNKYLLHLKNNINFILLVVVFFFGILNLIDLFIISIPEKTMILFLILSILIGFKLVFIQTFLKVKFNNPELSNYKLKDDEVLLGKYQTRLSSISFIKGDLYLTDKRIIFIPNAEFNNFYFEINIKDITSVNNFNDLNTIISANNKKVIVKIKDNYNFIKNIKDKTEIIF